MTREPRRGDFSQVAREVVREATAPHDPDAEDAPPEDEKQPDSRSNEAPTKRKSA